MAGSLVALHFGSTIVAGLFLGVPVMAVGKAFIDSTNERAALKSVAESGELSPTPSPPANEPQPPKNP
jgi:predicted PurR-regulated permease PerM